MRCWGSDWKLKVSGSAESQESKSGWKPQLLHTRKTSKKSKTSSGNTWQHVSSAGLATQALRLHVNHALAKRRRSFCDISTCKSSGKLSLQSRSRNGTRWQEMPPPSPGKSTELRWIQHQWHLNQAVVAIPKESQPTVTNVVCPAHVHHATDLTLAHPFKLSITLTLMKLTCLMTVIRYVSF